MRRLFALLLLASCASTGTSGSTLAPAVIRPSDDSTAVIRALQRVDATLTSSESGLIALERRLDQRTTKEAPQK